MRYLFLFLIFLTLAACGPRQSSSLQDIPKPDTLLSKEKMIRILTDIHLIEASLAQLRNKGDFDKRLPEEYYKVLFARYKISRKMFEANFDYYKQEQEAMIKMYEQIIGNLDRMQKSPVSKRRKVWR